MTDYSDSHGRAGFAHRFGLLTEEREKKITELAERVKGLNTIRLSFADQHGILRGKTIMADDLVSALHNGVTMTTTLLVKDTAHKTVYPVWSDGNGGNWMTGGGDFVMLPDPDTFRFLPWAPGTGWLLCDLYFTDGTPVPVSTRQVLKDQLSGLADAGFGLTVGLEVEFHVYKLEDAKLRPADSGQPGAPPEVSLLAQGFQYLTELRADQHEPVTEILRQEIVDLGLPLRTIEVEFGPSQLEFTFHPMGALDAADTMMLFRSAVKQVCRRHGYHATFMCRPNIANAFSSGWHLHQSLTDLKTGANAFLPENGEDLSPVGLGYAAGLLAHARGASVFTTPTINGYKRYRPHTLAPDRAVLGRDNRGAMVRMIGGVGDPGTRVENRIGEPAANPYLYIASQIAAGLDGINRHLDPGAPSTTPYDADVPPLPASLMEAVTALRDDKLFADAFGQEFIDYIITIKEAEIARFLSEVTDWEQREYFDIF
jgi:glutamine synthetase